MQEFGEEAGGEKLLKHYNNQVRYSYIWGKNSAYYNHTDDKIAKIRSVLASGGVIIAGGDRGEKYTGVRGQSEDCTASNGSCTFTPGGHFIAIIGITADDKLVVTNPGKSNNRTWIFPAANLIKHSNKAIKVEKK